MICLLCDGHVVDLKVSTRLGFERFSPSFVKIFHNCLPMNAFSSSFIKFLLLVNVWGSMLLFTLEVTVMISPLLLISMSSQSAALETLSLFVSLSVNLLHSQLFSLSLFLIFSPNISINSFFEIISLLTR